MIVHFGKLTTHLRSHKGMGDLVILEIVIQGYQVQTYFLGNDINSSTRRQGWVHIHHTSVEAITGIRGHMVTWLQVIVAAIPVAERHQVPMLQHTALWYTRRA